jgi:hypothetical protein
VSEVIAAALIAAGGAVAASLVHLLDRTIGRNMSGLNHRLDAVNGKLDVLSDRLDGKIDKLAERVESRLDNLIRTQLRVHERLGRLEARNDGDGTIPPINFEP